jgi:peptidyl-prolyl cis-trans isomerase C
MYSHRVPTNGLTRRANRQARIKLVVACLLTLSIFACGHSTSNPPASPTVATVAGQPITQTLFDHYIQVKSGATPDKVNPELRKFLLADLTRLKAAAIAGESNASDDIQQQLELQRLETLAHSAATAAGVFANPSDTDLKSAYDKFVNSLPASEYHVAHILVATEGAASVLITRLQSGQDFAKLATDESADDSKEKGGELGWISPGKLPPAFTDAVQSLKVNTFTAKPIHTAYGWHIIKLLETRPGTAPPFDQVKAQLAANLQQERYQQFLAASLKAATK